jgi:3-mercaptopyruvate sulfurtransferase SseA
MRKAVTVVAACALAAGIASAQMKPNPAGSAPLAVTGGASQMELALQKVRRISETDTLRMYNNNAAVIVDVRSNQQFSLNHIRGAVSIPGSQLVARLKELPAGKTIITYCA